MKSVLLILNLVCFCNALTSCIQQDPLTLKTENIKINSREERWILKTIKVTPQSSNCIELTLITFGVSDFQTFKTLLDVTRSDATNARGTIKLIVSKDGTVERIDGSFSQQVGSHWEYVPEVQKVPTFSPSKKLTMEILNRLAAKGLL